MKILFITNRLTFHQEILCQTLYKLHKDFKIILYERIPENKTEKYPLLDIYKDIIIEAYDLNDAEILLSQISAADIVIIGSAPLSLVKGRLNQGKLTFRYSERVYKKKCPWYEIPLRAIKYYFENQRHKSLYLLCASAFTAGDYAKTGTFKNRAYKWGYFPETKEYDIDKLLAEKTNNSILWAGRLIDWKHPEIPVKIAKRLKNEGFDFTLNMIGTGDMDDEIKEIIHQEGLDDNVQLLGSMTPQEVRSYMEKSKIFLFTSDRKEGWGAVLNEAMNSGCAVVASSQIGSSPYLIDDGENGFIYEDGNLCDLYEKVKRLLLNTALCDEFGKNAYFTITETWNGKNAAERLIALSDRLLKNESDDIYENGPCSKANILKDNWYK